MMRPKEEYRRQSEPFDCIPARDEISLEQARTVFDDHLYLIFADPDHSLEEHRSIIVGESNQGYLLVVAHREGDAIRIVSARKATRSERKVYEEGV